MNGICAIDTAYRSSRKARLPKVEKSVARWLCKFGPTMRKAGIERFRFHDLRHPFATRLVQAGVDLYAVQKLGRWKTMSMVTRYARHYSESFRAGVEVLDRVRLESRTILAQ